MITASSLVRLLLVGTVASLAACDGRPVIDPADQPTVPLNVRDFGATGDCVTDDHAAFQKAQAAATRRGGGLIIVPWTDTCYRIGTGTHMHPGQEGSGIVVSDGTHWQGEKRVRLVVGAMEAPDKNILFTVRDVSNVVIEGFSFDGQARTATDRYYQAVRMSGVVSNITIRDFVAMNFANFSMTFGEDDSPPRGYFDGVHIHDFAIGGVTGLQGTGSGINIFPRTQVGVAPRAVNLRICDGRIDVSNSESDVEKHGPQGIKVNNVDGVTLCRLVLIGGSTANLTLNNGVRNALVDSVTGFRSAFGLNITTSNNVATTRTRDVRVRHWTYDRDGAVNGRSVGLRLDGALRNVRIESARIVDASVAIFDNYESDIGLTDGEGLMARGIYFGRLTIDGGGFYIRDSSNPMQPPLEELVVDSLWLAGTGSTLGGRLMLDPKDWWAERPRFEYVRSSGSTRGPVLATTSVGGFFGEVLVTDGNTSDRITAYIVSDSGVDNQFGRIASGRQDFSHFLSKTGKGQISVHALAGTVDSPELIRIADWSEANPPRGALTVSARIHGTTVDTVIFEAAAMSYVIAGVGVDYVGAGTELSDVRLTLTADAEGSPHAHLLLAGNRESGLVVANTKGDPAFIDRFVRPGSRLRLVGSSPRAVQVTVQLIPWTR